MKHVKTMSRMPRQAQGGMCDGTPQSDLHVKLCFISDIMTGFFLPILEVKSDNDQDDVDPA